MKPCIRTALACIVLCWFASTAAAADWCHESLKREKYDAAIEACTTAIESKSGDLYANLVNRGTAYSESSLYDAAITDFTRAIELEPKLPKAYNQRGYSRALAGRYDEAEKDIKTALELDPDSTVVLVNMVELYALQNKTDLTCLWMRRLIEKGEKFWNQIRSGKAQNNMRNAPCFSEPSTGR